MGTKRPNRTPFDTLSNQKATDRHHLPDGRIAGENGQRQGTSAPSERGRGRIREEEQRGVREMERMKDKLRDKGKAIESLERYSGREVAPASRTREGERKWRERDKRQLEERLRNGRPVSNVESRTEHGIEREVEKGGTFPRMRNGSKERAEIMTALIEQEMERGGKAFIERHKRLEFDDWEMERVRERTRRTERQGDREYLKERERERDGTRRRPREEGKTNRGVRTREDGTRPQNERLRDSDPGFWETRREKDMEVNDLRDKRERDIARERERSRPGIGERERRMPSPRRRDREGYSEREVWEKPKRRDGKRGTKSEGDSDGGMRKGRGREGEREEWIYRHSRSEGDSIEQTKKKGREELRYSEDERMRYREKQRHRDAEGPRRRGQDGETSSERDWQFHRERDRRKHGGCEEEKGCRDGVRDIKGCRPDEGQRTCDRREAKRYREREDEERRYRERVDEEKRCREKRERRTDCRRYDATGGVGQSLSETAPKAAPQGQSSGEWSSDRDDENSQTRRSDSYEERESDKESTGESDQDVVHERSKPEKNEKVHKTSEKYEGVEDRLGERRGPVPEQRRMWLEPQRGKCSIESSLEDKFTEGGTHNRQKDRNMGQERGIESGKNCGRESLRESEEQHGRFSDQTQSSGSQQIDRCSRKGRYVEQTVDPGGEIEGVSVDEEGESGAWLREGGREVKEPPLTGSVKCPRPLKQENVKDNIEESDREGGSDYCTRSESEGGSETGWDHGRDRGLSGEDGFVTVSSGGDEEEEEREEDEFEDCRDFWEGGDVNCDTQPVVLKGHEGEMEKHNKQIEEFMVEEENRGQEKGKPPKYVFCVIGQTLPDSKPNNLSEMYQLEIVKANEPGSSQHRSDEIAAQPQIDMHPVLSSCTEYSVSDNQQEETRTELDKDASASDERSSTNGTPEMDSREKQRSVSMEISMENPYAEIGPVNRDAQTEQLLIEWREKNRAHKELTESYIEQLSPGITNPYDDAGLPKNSVPIPTTQDGAIPQTIDPDEEVSIQIRMSGAWSMEEEAKRRSQAPHLKWAKNVVTEILGPSEEHVIDDSALRSQESRQNVNVSEGGLKTHELKGTMAEGMEELPVYATVQKSRSPDRVSVMEVDEGEAEPLELEELRGMAQSRADMHADPLTAMHGNTLTYTHNDTLEEGHSSPMDGETDASADQMAEKAAGEIGDTETARVIREDTGKQIKMLVDKETSREKEVEMYLSVSNTLYKPSSCPCLNYDSEPNPLSASTEVTGQDAVERVGKDGGNGETPEEGSVEVVRENGCVDGSEEDGGEGQEPERGEEGGLLSSSCSSFRDLGLVARTRRKGIRKTTQRRKEELVKEEEGVGRDRRTRIFSATADNEDSISESWGEVDLRNVLDTVGRRKRNSKFFNAAPLYQQYSEEAQNIEILRQSRSDVLSTHEDQAPRLPDPLPSCPPSSSLAPCPAPACRPLPPLPPNPHPHSLSLTGSISNKHSRANTLPLPEPPKSVQRPHSPRLSISLGQSATLWQDLPGVRSSVELDQLSEDQRRLQEVRFEVVTSEASYCRSLDIVVEHFVKSKQLGVLLTTQDRNWLFSRLADVRAISHSFLSKLEEKVESDMIHFTVCDVIAHYCQRFKMVYVPYLTNQSYQDATYQSLMNENPRFKRIVEKLERSPVCQRLPLRSFLILPFQRITRIKLLVQNIVKRTAPATEEVMQAIKALKLLEKMIQESNDSISQMKSIESLVSLSAMVDFECRTLPLVSQSRRLVREGPVTELMEFSVKDTERQIYLHLFNDYLLLSLHKEGGRFTVIDHSPVSDLRAENCRVKLHSLQKNLFRLHLAQKALLLRNDTQSDKLRWISAISRPHPEVDFSAAQDFTQMQCIRAIVAQQPDELSLEKADVILVHQQSSDGWVEGTKLSDRQRGWMPASHLETITNSRVCQRNLSDALKLTTATAAV